MSTQDKSFFRETQDNQKMLARIEEEARVIDHNLIRSYGQYKMIQVGYWYGQLVLLEKIIEHKFDMPGINMVRNNCKEVRKSTLYNGE